MIIQKNINYSTTKNIITGPLLALFLSFMALILQFGFQRMSDNREWLFFYPAIFLTVWLRGARAGYFATIFCSLLAFYFLLPPVHSFKYITLVSALEIIILVFMGITTSFMMGKIHKQHRITEATSKELEKSSEYLALLIENLPLMVFVKDATDLRFLRFNKAGENLLGISREELLGKNDYDFFPSYQADTFVAKDREIIAGRVIVDIKEEVIQSRTHGTRILHTKKIPLFDQDGFPQYLLGVSEDITDKKNNEDEIMRMIKEEVALKERELVAAREAFLARVSTVLSSSLDFQETLSLLADLSITALGDWCTVSVINEEGKFERASASHIDKDKKELLDEYIHNYPPDEQTFSVINETSYLNPQIQDDQLKMMVKDERQLELLYILGANSSIIVPIKIRGKVRGSLSFIAGSTKPNFTKHDLHLAEDLASRAGIALENSLLYSSAQSAIKARDEFVSIASHELKTPITSLKLQLQMIIRGINVEKGMTPQPEKLLKSLISSTIQIDRLTVLIEDLLDVTRIETGKLTYKFEQINLTKLITEVSERFFGEMRAPQYLLEKTLEENVIIFCDPYRIEQVMVNLISNAIKYGANGNIKISLRKENGNAIILVKDSGLGIIKEMQTKIFERFERAISSTNISGLGLGLYISKQIIDAHQGTIEVESVLGQGSTFKVCLPTGI